MHAILSPSGASKWINCPPSALLEQNYPDQDSDYAKEGTLAHTLGELLIKAELFGDKDYEIRASIGKLETNPFYNSEMFDFISEYADFVVSKYYEALKADTAAVYVGETKFDLSEFIPDGFGTTDNSIISRKRLTVIDLKYGKGVPVSAVKNKQLMIYALGATAAFEMISEIEEVEIIIYQPRISNIDAWLVSIEDLYNWARTELQPAAEKAIKGEGEFKPGDHCRFCKARAVCRAHSEMQLKLAAYEFLPPAVLNDHEIADILSRADSFINWLKTVDEYALKEALNGKKWPGFKLVEGRSVRKISDEEKASQALEKYSDFDGLVQYQNIKLKGIGELEKLLGKEDFKTVLGPYIIKPEGKPTLVPENDKRPEIDKLNSALADFGISAE